jgi:hypothetical protein
MAEIYQKSNSRSKVRGARHNDDEMVFSAGIDIHNFLATNFHGRNTDPNPKSNFSEPIEISRNAIQITLLL